MADCGYEEVEHTADWALKVWGSDTASLFRCAAEGMLTLLGAEPAGPSDKSSSIELGALDLESLLVSWLEELLFQIEEKQVTYTQIQVEITRGPRMRAEMQESRSKPIYKQIKAVTFHELELRPSQSGVETTIIFDV